MPRNALPRKDDEQGDKQDGTAQGVDGRWPGAPEYRRDALGNITNAAGKCRVCGYLTTLSYRCSECGADLAGGSL